MPGDNDDADRGKRPRPQPGWLSPAGANARRTKRALKSEARVAGRLGGKTLKASGSLWASATQRVTPRADFDCPGFLGESKSTVYGSISLKLDWLKKIAEGATAKSKDPLLVLSFLTPQGDPRGDFAVLPLAVLERLCRAAGVETEPGPQ